MADAAPSSNLVEEQFDQENEAEDAEDELHPLQNEWCLWYFAPVVRKDQSLDYSKALQFVHKVASVEEFWSLFNHVAKPSVLQNGKSYYFFKEGIKPQWESEQCKNGAVFTVSIGRKMVNRGDDLWTFLLLACIGEQFEQYADHLLGACVAMRKQQIRFEIWINTTDQLVVSSYKNLIKQLLELSDNEPIEYKSIKEASAK